jgi:hypothetical protein
MICIIVDLPAPFFPINAILSVGLMAKETLLNRVLPLNSTARLSTVIIKNEIGPQKYQNELEVEKNSVNGLNGISNLYWLFKLRKEVKSAPAVANT